jgi:hypothetical protein
MSEDVYYIVGCVFATNRWEHWDGQLHATPEAGNQQVATAREYGFPHFQLYELRPAGSTATRYTGTNAGGNTYTGTVDANQRGMADGETRLTDVQDGRPVWWTVLTDSLRPAGDTEGDA